MVHKKNVQKLSWENMQKEEKSLVQTVVGEMIRNSIPKTIFVLTEVAGEGGTDCPPQKFLSSQKFRHLMG